MSRKEERGTINTEYCVEAKMNIEDDLDTMCQEKEKDELLILNIL